MFAKFFTSCEAALGVSGWVWDNEAQIVDPWQAEVLVEVVLPYVVDTLVPSCAEVVLVTIAVVVILGEHGVEAKTFAVVASRGCKGNCWLVLVFVGEEGGESVLLERDDEPPIEPEEDKDVSNIAAERTEIPFVINE